MDDMPTKMTTYANGDKFWWLNGKFHRTDGPAIEYADGDTEWWLHDQSYTFDQWLEVNSDLTYSEKVMMKLKHG
jgi:hypothetical protein